MIATHLPLLQTLFPNIDDWGELGQAMDGRNRDGAKCAGSNHNRALRQILIA